MLHLAAAALLSGCVAQELDGSWRHPPAEDVSGREFAYELALGQYGPEVAGLVWFYQGVTTGGAPDPYLFPVHCTTIESGVVRDGSLRFRFHDPDGESLLASLKIGEGWDELTGLFMDANRGAVHVGFRRVSDEVDRECGLRSDPFVVEGFLAGGYEGLPPTTRVVLAFSGRTEGGGFLAPWATAALDRPDGGAPTFSFELSTVPDAGSFAIATTDGAVRFAYGVFLAFDDEDGDGRWSRSLLGGGEPIVGVAADRALVYLEGRGAAVFPDRPDLAGALEPGYSLVDAQRGRYGSVEALEPTSERRVQVVVPPPASGLPLPWPE